MIANKMKGFVENSSAIRAMFEEGKRLAGIYGAENVYDFSLGNPFAPPPKSIKTAIKDILDREPPTYVHGYTNNAGYEDVRAAIAEKTNKKLGTSLTADNIIMTNGAAGALNIILKTLLDPGDEVLVFAPFFGEYKNYAENYGGVLVAVNPDTDTFQINLLDFAAKITAKTKAVIINTPNNPTGVVYSEETIKSVADILRGKQKEFSSDIYLISDEPYRVLAYDGISVPDVAAYYENTFAAYSYSKSLSLPGERIGYITVNSGMSDFKTIIDALSVANRILGFVNAPTLFQRVVPHCFDANVDISVYDKNRKLFYDMLTGLGFYCVYPRGAFYLFPRSPIPDDKEFCAAAKEFRLLIVPGSAFGCPGHFRIAYCVPYDTIVRSGESFRLLAEKFGVKKNG